MNLPYPKSFPNSKEESFLKLVLSTDNEFPSLWKQWTSREAFDDIDPATLHLMPLIHIRMKKLNLQDDPLYGRIKGIYKNAWVRNQQLLGLTRNIVLMLDKHNIPVMVLKGLSLLLDVYQDMGARFTGDADIAISPEHAPKVVSLMRNEGWHYQKPWMPDVNNPTHSMYAVSKSTDFENRKGSAIDMHWNIFGLYHHARWMDILFLKKSIPSLAFRNTFWEDAVTLKHSDFPAKRLSNEDLLIHIIIHGSEDSVERSLRWVTDAAAIIKTLQINWEIVIARSKAFGFSIELFVGLRYLREVMNLPIPESTLSILESVPKKKYQIREFYRRGTILGGDRFSPINNLLMFWYAYWVYEPAKKFPKTPFGFIAYTVKSLGMNKPRVFMFILAKYIKKLWRRITKTS